jgi:hypothetical protein
VRALPTGLQSHLDSGATTLCWCWRITRNDGVDFGFTDHDRGLVFDATTFEAASGFTGTEISGAVGLNVDTLDVESAITSDRLSEDDLVAGLFDNAPLRLLQLMREPPHLCLEMRGPARDLAEIAGAHQHALFGVLPVHPENLDFDPGHGHANAAAHRLFDLAGPGVEG